MRELICRKCNIKLDVSNFNTECRTKTGYSLDCKECYNSKKIMGQSNELYVKKRQIISHNRKNYTGKKFKMLTALRHGGLVGSSRKLRSVWIFKCDCGNITTKNIYDVKKGKIQSCGCLIKSKTGKNSYRWNGYKDISHTYFTSLKYGAKSRNILFKISMKYMWNLFVLQKNKCALSGVNLILTCGKDQTASLDRIDSTKGYIKGNVQWVHKHINIMKQAMSDEIFIDWCKKISNYQVTKNK